jgi:hypothetical protein
VARQKKTRNAHSPETRKKIGLGVRRSADRRRALIEAALAVLKEHKPEHADGR